MIRPFVAKILRGWMPSLFEPSPSVSPEIETRAQRSGYISREVTKQARQRLDGWHASRIAERGFIERQRGRDVDAGTPDP